eukprot:jgi/Mesvir1/13378/Mv15051-RA.1
MAPQALPWPAFFFISILLAQTTAARAVAQAPAGVTAPAAGPGCSVTGCDRGTCNHAEQVCRCQYGFWGSRCEEYMLRSCSFGRTDGASWSPPVLPPSLWTALRLHPVSCMCLVELRAANGIHRFQQEIQGKTECFVRVPTAPVTRATLLLHQHSQLDFGTGGPAGTSDALGAGPKASSLLGSVATSVQGATQSSSPPHHALGAGKSTSSTSPRVSSSGEPVTTSPSGGEEFSLYMSTLAQFDAETFQRACSVDSVSDSLLHRGAGAVPVACRQLADTYVRPHGVYQARAAGGEGSQWMRDAMCVQQVRDCEGVRANLSQLAATSTTAAALGALSKVLTGIGAAGGGDAGSGSVGGGRRANGGGGSVNGGGGNGVGQGGLRGGESGQPGRGTVGEGTGLYLGEEATETCCPRDVSRCLAEKIIGEGAGGRSMAFVNARCSCAVGLAGPRCEAPCKLGCVNECSGRGECLAAWCRCQQGWFGIDCSIPANETIRNNASLGGTSGDPGSGTGKNSGDPVMGNSASNPTVERVTTPLRYWRAGTPVGPTQPPPKSLAELKIYVYDVAPSVLQSEPCITGCASFCGDTLYKANIYFLSSLLRDPAHITYDPNEAHLFLAPLLPYRYSGNLGSAGPHILDTIDVIRPMGYFDRNGGRDHIWWAVGDRATCDVPDAARPGIIVGHYGRIDPRLFTPVPCVDPHKDLIAPPLTPSSFPSAHFRPDPATGRNTLVAYVQPWGVTQARAAYEGEGLSQPRPLLLFMAASNPVLGDPTCPDPNNDGPGPCREFEYGMGVRAAAFNWFREYASGMPDVLMSNDIHSGRENYQRNMRSSRFCLDALGHGFSTRIVDYVSSGCIPIIVRDDVLWPYESYEFRGSVVENWLQEDPSPAWGDFPRVRYNEFAVTFRKRDIPKILETLRGISDKRVRELRAGCQRVHKAFLWDQDYGMAYNYTIAALARIRASMPL